MDTQDLDVPTHSDVLRTRKTFIIGYCYCIALSLSDAEPTVALLLLLELIFHQSNTFALLPNTSGSNPGWLACFLRLLHAEFGLCLSAKSGSCSRSIPTFESRKQRKMVAH